MVNQLVPTFDPEHIVKMAALDDSITESLSETLSSSQSTDSEPVLNMPSLLDRLRSPIYFSYQFLLTYNWFNLSIMGNVLGHLLRIIRDFFFELENSKKKKLV